MKSLPLLSVDVPDLMRASLLLYEIEQAGELRASHAQHLDYVAMLCTSLLSRFEAEHGPVDDLTPEELEDED